MDIIYLVFKVMCLNEIFMHILANIFAREIKNNLRIIFQIVNNISIFELEMGIYLLKIFCLT